MWRQHGLMRPIATLGIALSVLVSVIPLASNAQAQESDPCGPGSNPIVCENSKPGTPWSVWDITGVGDESIQGFATEMSVTPGGTVGFKVDTNASAYSIQIYRTGWYGGDGARLIDTISPSATLPQTQPACLYDAVTGLLDCGNWAESASWTVPTDAVSGVYIARLIRSDTGGDSHVVFVVRNDSSTSDIVFQTSDTTWQAYNNYGGQSLYEGNPAGRAFKVSYNRPNWARYTPNGRDSYFGSEYAMVRWLERNGYDVTYISGVDTDRSGSSLLNHDLFLSVGHDEYWSGQQRTNVEAARDSGVNLAFLSGNEVYWKTRWEESIDGSSTPYRTLVTYKETKENAKIDPSPEWTGTWRDPRFSPPSDGGRPENELTGTLFTVNCCTYALRVPGEYGDLRFWRDTSVASLSVGQEKVFPVGTLGYEWDEDIDNGFRPAGVFRMSETTEVVPERLIDYGSTVAEEEATHHLMMYRAQSGALVFGAGTVQWSWGLDDYHDGMVTPTAPDMQQATVNVFADMGVQPATLQPGLIRASASTDSTAPSVSVFTPTAGQTFEHGGTVTVQGTASDLGGGVVAAVEVSMDGGTTWYRAEGRETWSYVGSARQLGVQSVSVRAVDDSGNLAPAASVDINVDCPCQLFADASVPAVDSFADTTAIELGVRFQSDIAGWISGVRFYKGPGNTGTHVGSLWDNAGTLLAQGTFLSETAGGWQELIFAEPVPISANTSYVASYHAPNGGYAGDTEWFALEPTVSPPLRAVVDGAEVNGVYVPSSFPRFPTESFGSSNYWVDVVFSDVEPPDTRAPMVVGTSPVAGASSVPTDVVVSVTFDEPIDGASVSAVMVDGSANPVSGSWSLDPASSTVTFTPAAALANDTAYTVTVDASDPSGNQIATPVIVSFTTALLDGAVAGLWDDSVVPTTVDSGDTSAVELGVKFTADEDLLITGVRFYKAAANTGTHVGSLWDSAGSLLARVTFGGESASGWQEASFSAPVAVSANTTYVVSYHAPNGRYSVNGGYFSAAYSSGPLTAPSTAASGGNGVYRYGATPGFPTGSFSAANYWVSPVYEVPPDTFSPGLESSAPVNGATSVPVDSVISATFDESVDPASVGFTLRDAGGAVVAGASSYDGASSTVTFTPSAPLTSATSYTAEVTATDLVGNATPSPLLVSFTTALLDGAVAGLWDDSVVPTTVDSGDTSAVELGVKFTADEDLLITGVRFYKAAANTGTHVGSLWDSAGSLLARVTFGGESASGWQEASFSAPVAVSANTTYVVSYHAPNGRYSVNGGYFSAAYSSGPLTAPSTAASGGNGVYRYGATPGFPTGSFSAANYWVSPVYEVPPDTFSPGLESSAPVNGATSVPVDSVISATFDESVDPASVGFTLRDAGGAVVAGASSYDGASSTVTFTPSAPLTSATSYTAEVTATDLVGNATPSPLVFSFTTVTGSTVAGLWDDSVVPTTVDSGDTSAVELGVKFTADEDLLITGVRFYKAAANTGTHVGSLWDSAGSLLARVTFGGESASGWQEASFSAPVAVSANTTYVVSYHAPNGRYSVNGGYFSAAYSSGPLTAPSTAASGGNGVYRYGATPGFPTGSFSAANYWVSPVYEVPPDTFSPGLESSAPVNGATSVPVDSVISATFDESVDPASVGFTLRDAGGAVVAGASSYDGASSTVTFTPSAPLTSATSYTAEVTATDLVGNATPSPLVFSFTTVTGSTVAGLWDDSVVPTTVDSGDTSAVELGVKFTADEDLLITGVRFYKAAANTGTHVGSLWDSAGSLLARVTFGGESASGWQEASFSAPVAVSANTTYVVSYHAPNGRYSVNGGYFSAAYSSGPLTAPSTAASGGNGVYRYGATPGFPSSSYNAGNYWVTPMYQVP